jgi:hypothetical protein
MPRQTGVANNPEFVSKLGKVKDIVLAYHYDISRERVRQIRERLKIPKYKHPKEYLVCPECGGEKHQPSTTCMKCHLDKSHGMASRDKPNKTYRAWHAMKQRCLNPDHHNYWRYGKRGIGVDPRWMNFENFLADMGEAPPKTSIQRIDNEGDYTPSNCKWATAKEQCANRRRKNGGKKMKPKRIKIALCHYYYHGQGWSFYKIAEHLVMSATTVKKYALEYKL